MCGFAGFLERPARPPEERTAILARMGRVLEHRGPDDGRTFDDGRLAFVFRRLSIVDVERGAQPLENEARSLVVAVNGEIYNHAELRARLPGRHTFATASDSEIAVHLFEEHGAGFLEALNGIYALLVWDRRAGRLLLARDRLGVKPLYWARVPHGLLFGSELKALLVHPDCPRRFRADDFDWSYLEGDTYTAPNWRASPTFVEGVEAVPGGSSLEAEVARPPVIRRYWALEDSIALAAEAAPRPARAYVDDYAELFEDSVRLQLMSDVPIGTFLSGGLDSSAIAAAARGRDMHCFSVAADTTAATGDLERARDLARALGLPLWAPWYDDEDFARQIDFSLGAFEYFVWMMDAPRFAPESFFKHELHRYAKTRVPELKVILLGQGADEFAGGYSTSLSSPRATWVDYLERELVPHHRTLGPSPPVATFHREMLTRVWVLQSHNLWNEDRVSSSQGIEARVPFLDHRLVEFLAAIPEPLHARLFFNKAILREAARRLLPPRYTEAPKVLFWQAEDTSSVHRLMRDCLDRSYPEFREEYRASGLDDLYRAAHAPGHDWTRASRELLGRMAIAVFERLCQRAAADDVRVSRLGPPSPLHEHAPQLGAGAASG